MPTTCDPPPPHGLIPRLMTLFFQLLYHPFAWAYDLVAGVVSLGRWQRWLIEAGHLAAGRRVLELGFGPGHLQEYLRANGYAIYGLDESPQMARMAQRRLTKHGGAAHLVRGLAQALPYPGAAFDSVIATFPTPYIIDPHTLDEVHRVLRPQGRLVVLMAVWHTGPGPLERLMALIFKVTGQAPREGAFQTDRLTHPLAQAGFDVEVCWVQLPTERLLILVAVPQNL